MPDDLLEFHEAVNSLQQQEEDVIDEHRELVGVSKYRSRPTVAFWLLLGQLVSS